MNQEDIQLIARTALDAAGLIILKGCADQMRDAVREEHREIHDMHQDAEDTEVSTEDFDTLISAFNFHSI